MLNFNQDFIETFVHSVQTTLDAKYQVEAAPLQWHIKGSQEDFPIVITGIVGITSEKFNGNINFSFTEPAFLAIVSKVLDKTVAKMSYTLTEGAAELLRVVYGNAKSHSQSKGYSLKTAIPAIVSGHTIQTKAVTKNPTLVVPFKTEFGHFIIEFTEQSLENETMTDHFA